MSTARQAGTPNMCSCFFVLGTVEREGREREREREREKERDRERVDGCGFPVLGWGTGAEFLIWGHLPLSEFRNFAGPGRGESGPGVGSGTCAVFRSRGHVLLP